MAVDGLDERLLAGRDCVKKIKGAGAGHHQTFILGRAAKFCPDPEYILYFPTVYQLPPGEPAAAGKQGP